MGLAFQVAKRSDDPKTKVGCVIVSALGTQAAVGCNHFILGVKKTDERLADKHSFMVHAEEEAIQEAYKSGLDTRKSTAYITWFPCDRCFRELAYAGVVRIVVVEDRMDHPRFKKGFDAVKGMAHDLGIKIDVYDPQV